MSSAPPRVSVAVATFNRARRLARLLEALRAQTLPAEVFEVIVVDDCSTDATQEVIAAELEAGDLPLRCLRHERNRGRAATRQDGWQAARADVVAFIDDDCVPTPDWLERGLETCAGHPHAIVQGRTEPDPAELDRLGPFSRTVNVTAFDAGFQTCNIFYPRHILEAVGGFDVEALGRVHGSEDSDLGWRAVKEHGAEAIYADDVRVHHAVNRLGPAGQLRVAAGWSMLAYARHPELRRAHFVHGVFWKRTHMWLLRALAGLLLLRVDRRLLPAAAWLAFPYARSLRGRGIVNGGGAAMAPYYLLVDLVELRTATRESVRHRTMIL